MKALGIGLIIQLLTSASMASSKAKTLWPEKDVKRPQLSRMPASYEYGPAKLEGVIYASQGSGVYMTVHRFDWQEEKAVLIGIKVQ